jgi:hypothetical protein
MIGARVMLRRRSRVGRSIAGAALAFVVSLAAPVGAEMRIVAAPAGTEPTPLLRRLNRPLVADLVGGRARVQLSGLLDIEGYYVDQRPPGLLFGGGNSFVNPRLSLFVDTRVGRAWYAFVEARADRGFDPRADSAAFRFDQYFLRYTPFADGTVDVQVGKFATVVGNWVARHDSWTNPLVNAPLPYENVTTASDVKAPPSRSAFLDRRRIADKKREWVPLVWGPSYTSGAAVFMRRGAADLALEVKNASLSSRPAVWDARHRGFAHPTVSGRVGWRPSAAWGLGASLSGGTYLRDDVDARAAGFRVGAHQQELAAVDATYAWRHVQLWAEAFVGRFEVPRVGNADRVAYYVEGRYKLTPRFFAALRWNEQFFGDVENDAGRDRSWDQDAWRVDAALGCRVDRHVQAKLQYSYTHQRGALQQGEQLVAAQVTLKF